MSDHSDNAPTLVDDRHALVIDRESSFRRLRGGPVSAHWWLLRDGVPVAFLKTLMYAPGTRDEHALVLCDIEVRNEYRRQGLSRVLVGAVENAQGQKLWTSGSFTPLGAQALGFLPVLPGETAEVKFKDMVFVDDWSAMISKYPH